MRKFFLIPLLAFAAMLLLAPSFINDAVADSGIVIKPNGAKKFAVMPAGATNPEGITITSNGDVVVGTFGAAVSLVRFDSVGNLIATATIPGGPLLGIAYNPADDKIYLCSAYDLASNPPSKIQRIDADFTDGSSVEDVADVPSIGAPGDRTVGNPDGSTDFIDFGNAGRAPNDLTFASNGDLYYSDSFQGAVFRINDAAACPGVCSTDTISHDPLLATAGFPPFGANGVALNGDETTLFVANTGDDTVLTVNVSDGAVGVLAQSINGADGIIYDSNNDLLWVAANQADQVVAIDPDTGRVVAEIGEFLGINPDGSARGLLFPASLVEAANGKILVTNLAAVLIGDGSEPEGDVSKYTVSFINIPEFDD
ncbi:MAG: SMP-30/gluconolactonase/LRE family protein [Proteobacteria bacterium]|nr:SMP-30/gluconolactonase/LRE family protein [Pseudomonadota bacterium]